GVGGGEGGHRTIRSIPPRICRSRRGRRARSQEGDAVFVEAQLRLKGVVAGHLDHLDRGRDRHERARNQAALRQADLRPQRRDHATGAARCLAASDADGQGRHADGAVKMKKIILAFALVLAATAAGAEQQTRLYRPDGRSVGTAVPLLNGSVRYFDARGNSLGTSTTTGNTTKFY